MSHQIDVPETAAPPLKWNAGVAEALPDVAYQRLAIVNVVYVGRPDAGDRQWVLIDAGVMGSMSAIVHAAEARFGKDARPAAIVLTHGHFDHVGALELLADHWSAPIFAHPLEIPYLDGSTSYPPPDPTVGGGLMSTLSRFFPRGPVNVKRWLNSLHEGIVPGLPGWRWIETPGHSPGHISFWRESDRCLISGDAVITTDQESAYAVLFQKPEIHGPPKYFTTDWIAARDSTQRLADLEPETIVTGHGPAMRGSDMRVALRRLVNEFDHVAVPEHGMYVQNHL